MNSNLSTKSVKIRQSVLDFVKKEYGNSGIVPSARKIEKTFKIGLFAYFPNGIGEIYELCKFQFTPEDNKKKSVIKGIRENRLGFNSIKEGKEKILEYFKREVKGGEFPTKEIIEREFNISLHTYFKGNLKELYKLAKVAPIGRLRDREELKTKIIRYVQSEVGKGHYPTYQEIDEKFNTNLNRLFSDIKDVYWLAKVNYKREPNPFLKYEKEERLAGICIKIFSKLGYKIEKVSIGPSTRGGADIIIRDSKNNLVPVEIKAYQKFGKIGNKTDGNYHHYFRDEIAQLKVYIEKMKSPYGFLVSSTDRKLFKKTPSNIRVMLSKDIEKLLLAYELEKELKDLHWIRNTYVSTEKSKTMKTVQNRILTYVKEELSKGKYVSKREIVKKLKINPATYFSNMKEIYIKIGIDPYSLSHARMGGQIDKEVVKKRILEFIQEQTAMGHYPTYKAIQKRFRCLPKLFFSGGIREMYKLSEVNYSGKFATKTKAEKEMIRSEIIEFVKRRHERGQKTIYEDIINEFHITISNYFSGIRELHEMAGINIGHRKGLRVKT